MHEGHELAWALKWEAASQKYREALALLPNDPTARLSLAVSLNKTGRLADALEEYLAARELLPRDALVLGRIAELRLRLGQPDEAVRAYLDLADLHLDLGERARAVAAWRSALEHAAGQRRHLQAIKQALARAGGQELLGEVEAALAQARPERLPASAAAAEPVRPPSAELAPPDKPRPAAEAGPAPASARAAQAVDDPAQRLVEAERHARAGEAAAAVVDYLRAADLLSDEDATAAARRAAAGLVGDWLEGDLEEAAGLPAAKRAIVLEAMAASHAHLARGQGLAALDECFRAIGAGFDYLPAQIRLAQVYRQMGRVDEARERVEMVVDLHELRGEPRRAAATIRMQIALEPEREELWRRLVDCDLAARDSERAADDLLAWAERLLAAGDADGGIERQREALHVAPRADHWLKHGYSLEDLGQVEEALAAFEAARGLAPAEELIAAAQSRCEALLGRWPAMEGNLGFVLAAVPVDPILAEEAIARYRAALARQGENSALRYCLGMALHAVGQSDEAAMHLACAAAGDDRPARLARYNLARLELAAGQTAQAIVHLRGVGSPAAANETDRALALASHQLLADACERASDWEGAARALEALRLAKPSDEALYARLGEIEFRAGQVPAALATLDQLADLYRARRDDDRAVAIYRGMVEFAPDDPMPREKLGRLHLELGQIEAGLTQLELAATLQLERRQDAEAADNLLLMLDTCRQTDPTRALIIREWLAGLRPGDVELRGELVAAYLKAGRSVRALAEARSMVDYLLGEERLEEAAAALRLVVQLDPWNLGEQVRLGNLLAQLGRTDEAVAALKRVLARDPGNQAAARALSSILGGAAAAD